MFYFYKDNLLTNDLYSQILSHIKDSAFQKAKVQVYNELKEITQIRNNSRLEWDNQCLANNINNLLLLTEKIPHQYDGKAYQGVNGHFRIYHYGDGEYFKPHRDGAVRKANKTSLITVLFYLNDVAPENGGQTILMPNGVQDKTSWITIQPTKGSVLMFDHRFWHQSTPIQKEEKLVLRTELFYA